MSRDPGLPNVGALKLEDSDPEGLFDSPDSKRPDRANGVKGESDYNAHSYGVDDKDARETALRRELEGVRHMNEVIEDLIASLQKARDNTSVGRETMAQDRVANMAGTSRERSLGLNAAQYLDPHTLSD